MSRKLPSPKLPFNFKNLSTTPLDNCFSVDANANYTYVLNQNDSECVYKPMEPGINFGIKEHGFDWKSSETSLKHLSGIDTEFDDSVTRLKQFVDESLRTKRSSSDDEKYLDFLSEKLSWAKISLADINSAHLPESSVSPRKKKAVNSDLEFASRAIKKAVEKGRSHGTGGSIVVANQMIAASRRAPNPIARWILEKAAVQIIVGLAMVYPTQKLQQVILPRQDPPKIELIIKSDRITQGFEYPIDSRVVIADLLEVLAEPRNNSRVLGRLHYGYQVKIIRKKMTWSHIEFVDPATFKPRRGWVQTQYLARPNRVEAY